MPPMRPSGLISKWQQVPRAAIRSAAPAPAPRGAATRFKPARARTRVTVERGTPTVADLPRRRAGVAQREDCLPPARRSCRAQRCGPRRAILRNPAATARHPFRHGAHADGQPRRFCHTSSRAARESRSAVASSSRLRVTMNSHSGAPPETLGWCGNPIVSRDSRMNNVVTFTPKACSMPGGTGGTCQNRPGFDADLDGDARRWGNDVRI